MASPNFNITRKPDDDFYFTLFGLNAQKLQVASGKEEE